MSGPARVSLLVIVSVFALLFATPHQVRGDVPTFMDNGNASRTIIWNTTDLSGLSYHNVSTSDGNASLPWRSASMSWNAGTDFAANGTLPPQAVANSTGVSLWANTTDYVVDGNFSSQSHSWSYANGSRGNLVASWNPGLEAAQLDYVAPSTESLWDGMDTAVQTNWGTDPSFAAINQNTTGMKQGSGMMGILVALPWSQNHLGIVNKSSQTTALNWSQFDRLVVWIHLNASLAVGFNVTAVVAAGGEVGTSNQSLGKGWQELTVNLDELGDASVRADLTQVTLRFNGAGVPTGTWFNIDDVRLGKAKDFAESAAVSQQFDKPAITTPRPGSALLAFDWMLTNATGVSSYAGTVNVTASTGPSYVANLPLHVAPSWNHASLDVSATTESAGAYNLSFALWVDANTTAPTNVTLFVDNVSLFFPDRQNGTYLSNRLTMGYDSAYLNLSWAAEVPTGTTLVLGMRSTNDPSPNANYWSPWQTFTMPGTYGLSVPGAIYFQLQADLGTTNASRTPVLLSVDLQTKHHLASGWLQSQIYPALGDFLQWATFNATVSTPYLTSVSFFVGNGTNWFQVMPGASLSFLQGSQVQWRAVLVSTDLLVAPAVHDVRITYEYTGRPVRVQVFHDGQPVHAGEILNVSVGQYVHFTATVYDAGSHVVPSVLAPLVWASDDAKGSIGLNGSYLPGGPGLHWVNVTVSGYPVFASIRVFARGASLLPTAASLWDLWPLYAVAIAAMVGYGVYEVVIRRMFAIDDIFLIAKDGRLMMHNTRRMRADRDEDILSGMLTAIMAFLRDQDPEENGELKKFQVGGKTTLLERGRHVYLAAIYSGRVPRWAGKDLRRFMADLEREFGDPFSHWSGSPEDLHGLKEFMRPFVTHLRYRGHAATRGRAS